MGTSPNSITETEDQQLMVKARSINEGDLISGMSLVKLSLESPMIYVRTSTNRAAMPIRPKQAIVQQPMWQRKVDQGLIAFRKAEMSVQVLGPQPAGPTLGCRCLLPERAQSALGRLSQIPPPSVSEANNDLAMGKHTVFGW